MCRSARIWGCRIGRRSEGSAQDRGIFSVSGPAASFGIPERDIVDVLVKRTNEKGGINGRKIEIIFCDDQTNPTESARCATKLVRQDGVLAIVGPTIGTGALALLPVAMRAHVPVVAPVGTVNMAAVAKV